MFNFGFFIGVFFFIYFGFALPYLLSSKSTELVLIGIGSLICSTYIILKIIYNAYKRSI